MPDPILDWFSRFRPSQTRVRWPERMRACVGALVGIALTGLAMRFAPGGGAAMPLLIAPMGASAVLLFGVPASPLAQPWSIFGGNLVSAFVGVTCATLIAQPVDAAACAIALAIGAMFALRCVHPPSGAVALTAVLGGPSIHALGYGFVLAPVGVQTLLLLGSALAYHAATGHRYPHAAAASTPDAPADRQKQPPTFTHADFEAALSGRDDWLDIAPDDLEALLRDLQRHAYVRASQDVTAADIMSPPAATVPATASAADAWQLLHRHDTDALPVTDAARRVAGVITRDGLHRAGFAHDAARPRGLGLRRPARRFDRRAAGTPVHALLDAAHPTIHHGHPVVDLLALFARGAHAHLPVLDDEGRLAGIVTQADLIAGLHRQTHRYRRQPTA
ncbi:CBS domain-containing membrane protein [Paraburkholderia caballeronis]|uniref:HPP family protein n=1 Tax=Paraburkholderia caballeronis TaxID=416943 RepID=UPI0010ED5C51|nr:HPP family protein [Paraburkholderia caballeronis]TDV37885.1 CBS domain-containing membrane protein [Paraburkholderia caballeronis]